MARPRKITEEQRTRIINVALERRRLPSDKELAAESGVSVAAVRFIMTELLALMPVKSLSRVGMIKPNGNHRATG